MVIIGSKSDSFKKELKTNNRNYKEIRSSPGLSPKTNLMVIDALMKLVTFRASVCAVTSLLLVSATTSSAFICIRVCLPSENKIIHATQFSTWCKDRKHWNIIGTESGSRPRTRKGTTLFSSTNPTSSNNNPSSRKGILSSTARESAVIVEWEPVSELQRRIDEGMYYEHDSDLSFKNEYKTPHSAGNLNDPSKKGVFCGYRTTPEEITRLRSANPGDY